MGSGGVLYWGGVVGSVVYSIYLVRVRVVEGIVNIVLEWSLGRGE